jgi:peptide/nickel transport system substrate-binding protein
MKKENMPFAVILTMILAAGALVFTGCSGSQKDDGSGGGSGKDTLVYGVDYNAEGYFHPTLYYTNPDREVIFLVFSRLITEDPAGGYLPELAESYTANEDSSEFVFKIRRGIKWTDGTDLTAHDAAFTYETTCHPKFRNGFDVFSQMLLGSEAYHEGKADHVEGIKVVDDYTVSFTFKGPYLDAMVKFIDRPVLAKHIWETVPVENWADATDLLRHPVGTGPYKLAEYVQDQYVRLERNDDYFKGAPRIKTFVLQLANRETRQAELINGTYDITSVTSWRAQDMEDYVKNNIPIKEVPAAMWAFLSFDMLNPGMRDVRLRRAVIHALDRPALIKGMWDGHGVITEGFMQPTHPMYPNPDHEPYDYNPEKAKALLAEMGYTDTNGDGFVDKNGQPLRLTFHYNIVTLHAFAQMFQQYLKAAGIDIELVGQDFNTVQSVLRDRNKYYDIVYMGGTYRPDPGFLSTRMYYSRFDTDQKFQELLAFANAAPNAAEAKVRFRAYSEYVHEMVPQFVIYSYNVGYAVNPKLRNYEPTQVEWFPKVETWYFE